MGRHMTVNRCPGCGLTYEDADAECAGGIEGDLGSPAPHELLQVEKVTGSYIPDEGDLPEQTSATGPGHVPVP